jgi:hypothetical protein
VSVPLRYIVELRPPRKGERYLSETSEGEPVIETAEFDYHGTYWVVVDPVPEDALQRLREAIRTAHLDNDRDLLIG